MKEIAYSRDAAKTLARMPRNLADRIREKIGDYAADPTSQANNVARLHGLDGVLRLRVGNWRVLFRDEDRISVINVAPRGDAYRE